MKVGLICCLANVTPIIQVGPRIQRRTKQHMVIVSVHVQAGGYAAEDLLELRSLALGYPQFAAFHEGNALMTGHHSTTCSFDGLKSITFMRLVHQLPTKQCYLYLVLVNKIQLKVPILLL